MLKDIMTINVQGANFGSVTPLSLFDARDGKDKEGNDILKTIKGVLMYGRNGTGKSTIAKAFRKAKGEYVPAIKQVSFLDKDGKNVDLTEDDKKHIFVFDEDYINKQVRLKEEHLETIIMLGQAADLADKIEEAEKKRDAAKDVLLAKEAAFNEFQDTTNPKSPKKCLNRIAEALRGDDAWAGRDRIINGGRYNTQVRDETYKQFLLIAPTKTKVQLLLEYEEKTKTLEIARNGSSKIETRVPSLPKSYDQYDDASLIALLAKKIEKPELSGREQYLLRLVESGKAAELSQKAAFFKDDSVSQCPYCFQTITNEYKTNLVASIEKVLSKAVDVHQKALERHVYGDVIIDILPFARLNSFETCKGLIDKINASIQQNNKLIQKKVANPYNPIEATNLNITEELRNLDEALTKLESERTEYNRTATDVSPIIAKLNEINSHIAHYDVKDFAAEYDEQLKKCKIAEENFKTAKADYEAKKNVADDLEARRKNVQLALNIINACLKYIFFAEDRLKIEYIDGEYRLFSQGKSVRPCDVSVGERNIIGLSYFFTSIMEGQEEKDAYGKEYLLIIDDPVSSYDTENRIGILSFLKYKLNAFLECNEFSKAFVMTHDLMTFYDMHKLFEGIIACCKKQNYTLPPKFNTFEIADCAISPFRYNKRQEYTELLKVIYNYGQGNANNYDIVIGNMMRQVLEAFATFQYKKGIEDVSTDSEILALLPEPEYQSYYKNLMYRLVLHGGSHKEEQIKAMKDYGFFTLLSETEKKRTAKEVLCFIYLLNKRHVLQHLQEIKNVETTLNAWCSEVKMRSAVP